MRATCLALAILLCQVYHSRSFRAKIEPGETPEQALVRELDEELGLAVDAAGLAPAAFATAPLGERHLLLLLYVVRRWSGEPHPTAADAIGWYRPEALRDLPMPPADAPLVVALAARI